MNLEKGSPESNQAPLPPTAEELELIERNVNLGVGSRYQVRRDVLGVARAEAFEAGITKSPQSVQPPEEPTWRKIANEPWASEQERQEIVERAKRRFVEDAAAREAAGPTEPEPDVLSLLKDTFPNKKSDDSSSDHHQAA